MARRKSSLDMDEPIMIQGEDELGGVTTTEPETVVPVVEEADEKPAVKESKKETKTETQDKTDGKKSEKRGVKICVL